MPMIPPPVSARLIMLAIDPLGYDETYAVFWLDEPLISMARMPHTLSEIWKEKLAFHEGLKVTPGCGQTGAA